MRKYLVTSFFILLFPLLSLGNDLSLESGSIYANIQTIPSELVALEPATLFIEIRDRAKLFSLKRCDCRIKITDSRGKEMLNGKLEQNEQYIEDRVKEIPIKFPNTGTFLVVISGESTNKIFPSFQMSGEINISSKHKTEAEKRLEHFKDWLISLGLPLAVVLGTAGIIFRFILKKR